jgi:NTE family protein
LRRSCRVELAEAVAASATFPVALAPLAIRNHSPCAAQDAQAREGGQQPRWPPVWLQNAVATNIYTEPDRVRRGRVASTYLNLDCGPTLDANACAPLPDEERRRWVHLLDGGIADNLGLSEPIRLLSSVDVSPRFLTQIFDGEIARLGFVVVNARSEADRELDRSGATPGVIKMLDAATGSAIDAASFGALDQLRTLIKDLILLRAQATGFEEFIDNARDLEVFVIPVDIDYIERPG